MDNKISNIVGVPIPQWLVEQFNVRSQKGSQEGKRDVQELQFLANKTAWVRVVSSVQVSEDDNRYFSRFMKGETLFVNAQVGGGISFNFSTDVNSLAKNFVLFAGTSKYQKTDTLFSQQLRSGIDQGAYAMLGEEEVNNYGYQPMPGITSVNIETMGRMGSVKSATVNFKVFNKFQLDVVDALYFKLGYTMLLEWGHTYYYESKPNVGVGEMKLKSTEDLMIDAFSQNLSKEKINYQISLNRKKSYGNYDGILGMVTNFSFSRKEDGSYDCSIKLIGLGAIAESLNIARPTVFNELIQDQIKKLVERENEKRKQQVDAQTSQKNERLKQLEEEKKRAEEEQNKTLSINEIYQKKIDERNKNISSQGAQFSLSNFLYLPGFSNASSIYDENVADVVYDQDQSWAIRKFGLILNKDTQINNVTISSNSFRLLLPSKENFIKKEPFAERDKIRGEGLFVGLGLATDYDFYSFEYRNPKKDFLFTTDELSPQEINLGVLKQANYENRRKIIIAIENPQQNLVGIRGSAKIEEFFSTLRTKALTKALGFISGVDLNIPTASQIADALSIVFKEKAYDFLTQNDEIFVDGGIISIENVFLPNLTLKTINSNVGTNFLNRNVTSRQYPSLLIKRKIVVNTDRGTEIPFDIAVFITDSGLIKNINVQNKGDQISKEFLEKDQSAQDIKSKEEAEKETLNAEIKKIQDSLPKIDILVAQKEEAGKYPSSIETALRTIQIYSLNKVNQSNEQVVEIDFLEDEGKLAKSIFDQPGLYSEFYGKIISNSLSDIENYGNGMDKLNLTDDQILEFYMKYGFNASIMSNNHVTLKDSTGVKGLENKIVDHRTLLKSYIAPYQISQEFSQGITLERPVYIKLGTLLMLMNHMCLMYDSKKEKAQNKRPFFYVDYNPNTNFCLTCLNHLTTNPFNFIIPYSGDREGEKFKELFSKTVLDDSFKNEPLFKPKDNDALSRGIPNFIEDGSTGKDVYRGKVMNILIEVDYLLNTIKRFCKNDGTNSVYFKPFIDNLLSDLCKYLGNYNLLRLAYNDEANCFYIVDDQLVPPDIEERQIYRKREKNSDYELPLYGKTSIAKSLDIKTDISSRLSNLVALSANSEKYQGEMSSDSTPFGFINKNFRDRYVTLRGDFVSENSKDRKKDNGTNTTGDITAAEKFNSAIKAFYGQIDVPRDYVESATPYYISRISKIKSEDPATRASAIIPVSINFTTDGISGFNMYQSFCVNEELLPYTYTAKNKMNEDSVDRRVGFCVIGLSHTIENNQWNTSVKSNMVYLRDNIDYVSASKEKNESAAGFTKIDNKVLNIVTNTKTGRCDEPYTNKNLNKGWEGKKQAFRRTEIDPNIEGKKLTKAYGSTLARAIMATIKLEQNFRGFNYNFGGFDITAGGWKFNPELHDGYVVALEGGTGLCKAFISFKSYEAFVKQKVQSFKEKGFESADTDNKFAKLWYEKWNGFGARTKYKGRPLAEIDAKVIGDAKIVWNNMSQYV